MITKPIATFLFSTVLLTAQLQGQARADVREDSEKNYLEAIRDEGLERSELAATLSYLTDVIGARLTGSPAMKEANEWTRDKLKEWGLQHAHLEAWGPFGRGWSLEGFSAEMEYPEKKNLIAAAKAWSPPTDSVVKGQVVYFNAKKEEDFARYKDQLDGRIVLVSSVRPLKDLDSPLSVRFSDSTLSAMAQTGPDAPTHYDLTPGHLKDMEEYFNFQASKMRFLMAEGAAVMVDNSPQGSGGTLFVQGASLARDLSPDPNTIHDIFDDPGFKPYRPEAETYMLPQVTLATEDYNRLIRMLELGVTPIVSINVDSRYHDTDTMSYNTIAEIPGSDPDLKDEIVMLGAHLDSWHSSTGATDNAAGCAVVMEAVRILMASGMHPRRTIRIALWSGEEQGLLGSSAYVKEHFGYLDDGSLVKSKEYDKLSAYYNLDNGTGKIRGIYLQGNEEAMPYFESWFEPFQSMGAKTLTLSNTGGTDHLPFDAIGLPGFQFIQDEVEYMTRTHHSNQDNYDRIQLEDLEQAAVIMAAIVYKTAMMQDRLPRKSDKQIEYLKD